MPTIYLKRNNFDRAMYEIYSKDKKYLICTFHEDGAIDLFGGEINDEICDQGITECFIKIDAGMEE